jgi:hypothetical protein
MRLLRPRQAAWPLVAVLLGTGGIAAPGRSQTQQSSSAASGFVPAPMPDPDVRPPPGPAASLDPSLSPGLFMPRDRFGGDGYTPGSTVQSEQERRRQPGAGLNLKLPFD